MTLVLRVVLHTQIYQSARALAAVPVPICFTGPVFSATVLLICKNGGGVLLKVLCIGGLFFRAENRSELADWNDRTCGVTKVPDDYDQPSWRQQEATTVFAPFDKETSYFDRPDQAWMINFRVADLDDAVAELHGQNIAVAVDPETYPNGRVARLSDLEGNPIQLWEPQCNGS